MPQTVTVVPATLFSRSEGVAQQFARNLRRFFDADAPHSVVELFGRMVRPRTG